MDNYNYKKHINVITTPNGDKVITMNSQIYVELLNDLYASHRYYEEQGHNGTADSAIKMWRALDDERED